MDRIHYAGNVSMTGTAIARALVDYAQALARKETSATIDIPVRFPDGSTGNAEFLLGPASQLVTETLLVDGEELVDEDAVERLVVATRAIMDGRARPLTSEPYSAESISDLDLSATDDF
jgi:hypothetical protein